MGLPRATAFRFGQGHFEAVFNFYLIAGETKNGRAKSTRWSVWQSCFWGCDMTLGTHPAASKVRQKTWNHRRQEGWHKHPRAELVRTAFGSPNSIYLSNPKMGIKQIEQFSDIILRMLRFLRSRLESQSWNSFNPFPIANGVSAGVPTPPDSGKTLQLKTSKLAQNCGKIEVLHLQPSYGICWSHEIETLPNVNKGIIRL